VLTKHNRCGLRRRCRCRDSDGNAEGDCADACQHCIELRSHAGRRERGADPDGLRQQGVLGTVEAEADGTQPELRGHSCRPHHSALKLDHAAGWQARQRR